MNDNAKKRKTLINYLSNETKVDKFYVSLFNELDIYSKGLEKYDMKDLHYVDSGNDYNTTWALAVINDNIRTIVSESYCIGTLKKLIEEKLYPKTKQEKELEELQELQTEVKEYYVLPFGKYKGTAITDMTSPEQVSYCKWILKTKYSNKQKSRNKSTERKALEWWVKQR